MKSKLENFKVFILALLFNFIGGYVSTLLSGDQKALYESLSKPWFAPPNIVFPIVWWTLYIILALAVILNYKNGGRNFFAYYFSMFLSFVWNVVFFGQQLYGLAFFLVLIIMIFTIYLCVRYFKNSKIASLIMFIYLLWLSYAALLNYFIWMYNEM